MKLFRKLLPTIVLILLVLVAYQWTNWQKKQPIPIIAGDAGASSTASSQSAVNVVVVGAVATQVVNDRLNAIGTGRAVESVEVRPWSSGVMDKIFVHAGEKVRAQDAIAELDSDNEKIAVERAKVQLNDAQLAMERTMKLRASNTASGVQEINANLALENAKLALKDAELALRRRTILSPISGIVGILPIDAGNYVTADTVISRIDDRDKIRVDIWVPERFSPLVHIGDELTAISIARPGENFLGHIVAIDNMIDAESRTLRVRGEINNDKDVLRAGMSFAVTLHFPGDPFPTVSPLAIQWSGEGAYVWRVKNAKVERVPITIVQRNTTSVLVNAKLSQGDLIVVQGVQNLHEGSEVSIQNTITKTNGSTAIHKQENQ